jgi:hypothetical protein
MTLFVDIDELARFVKVSTNMDIATLVPFIEEAEISFMNELIGEQYDLLQTDYEDNAGDTGAMNVDLAALLPYVQRPLAYHAMFLATIQLGVKVGNIGITHERHDKGEPAPKWKVDKLEAHYLRNGDLYAEKLLEFLEENASPTKYSTWYASDKNTINDGLILRTAKIAVKHVDIEQAARRIFIRMKKRVRLIESTYIKQLICKEQYDEIVTQIKTDSLSVNNQALSEYLEPIIAKMALHQTLPSLRLHLSGDGITIFSSSDSTISRQAASHTEVKGLMMDLRSGDFGYEKDIEIAKEYIDDNIDTYPLIKNSSCYTSKADPGPKHQIANEESKKYFAV